MKFADDILQLVPDEDLPKLRDFYKGTSCAPYLYSFFNTVKKWNAKRPDKGYIRIYAPNGDWRTDGTFIAHLEFYSYDFLVFTKEESCDNLYECLTRTKRFKYTAYRTMFYVTHRLHVARVMDVIKEIAVPVDIINVCDIFWMPKEKAVHLTVEIPPEVYLSVLSKKHAPIINQLWPHKYENSEKYLEVLMEMGRGYGLFLKSDDSIVSWIFKNAMGTLGILQTAHEHKRKGYGTVLTRYLSREIGEDGHDPLGTVLLKNAPSRAMFEKMGFKVLDRVAFIECVKVH